MGYRIDYGKNSITTIRPVKRSYRTPMVVSCLIIFLILVNLFWSEGASLLKTVLIPQFFRIETEAIEVFLLDVREGNTIAESLRSFYRVILQNAGFL